MAPVDVTVEIDAQPERVFTFLLDMQRTPEWVTIVRAAYDLDPGDPEPGWGCKQRYVLRGAPFVVTWKLDALDEYTHISWSGKGPARSKASIQQDLEALPGGRTRLRYRNEFKAPGGLLGAAASRALVGGIPETEARASLARLAELLAAEH